LDRYVELYNEGDLDGVMDLYAEDAVQLMPDGIFKGRGAIQVRLARELDACSDVAHRVESFVEQGDAFADEWTFVGTHTGSFSLPDGTEIPATGNRIEIRGMELVQVREGKIVIDNLYYDTSTVLAQLGLGPARDGNGAMPAIFEVAARIKVRDGELDGFKLQAAEIMKQVKEKDTKTLRYDWFLSDDGTECEVREGYVDADAVLEHAQHIREARSKLFSDFAYDHNMTLYGEPSPALAAAFDSLGSAVTYKKFSFLQGLGAEDRVPDKVPA
jgi:steroid delta-isomerase-like uncharacterized protein